MNIPVTGFVEEEEVVHVDWEEEGVEKKETDVSFNNLVNAVQWQRLLWQTLSGESMKAMKLSSGAWTCDAVSLVMMFALNIE